MNKPGLSETPARVLLAGWLIVVSIVGWLSSVVMPTEQDFLDAGVYLGEQRD